MGKIRRGWSKQIKSMENGKVKKHIKRHKNIADYQVYDGLHPPLISEDTYHAVQSIRQEKKPGVKVRKEFELQNAFAGLIYCSICGKRIGRTTAMRGEIRFRCTNSRNCHNVSADYAIVEKQIIEALKVWLEGYKVKVDTVGFADEIADCRTQLEALEQEAAQLNQQLENAFDLVEQGLYTLDCFRTRRDKLNSALSNISQKKLALEETIAQLSEADQSSLVPQAEQLLDSYGEMTVAERNELLKNILCKIGYLKHSDGQIEIDLYPRLPKI